MKDDVWLEQFRLIIASLPDRDQCVCEIYYRHVQWAELRIEGSQIIAQFYSGPRESYWEFPLNIAMQILKKAKDKLLDGST